MQSIASKKKLSPPTRRHHRRKQDDQEQNAHYFFLSLSAGKLPPASKHISRHTVNESCEQHRDQNTSEHIFVLSLVTTTQAVTATLRLEKQHEPSTLFRTVELCERAHTTSTPSRRNIPGLFAKNLFRGLCPLQLFQIHPNITPAHTKHHKDYTDQTTELFHLFLLAT